jgi:hypothetical protein
MTTSTATNGTAPASAHAAPGGDNRETLRAAHQHVHQARQDAVARLNQAALELRQQARTAGYSPEALAQIDALAAHLERQATSLRYAPLTREPAPPTAQARQHEPLLIAVAFVVGLLVGLLFGRARRT